MTGQIISPDGLARCFGNRAGQDALAHYHDTEWGVPVHEDRHLFEMLTLEGAQAGLSWEVVLKKRPGYRAAFQDFDRHRVAAMTDDELEALRDNPGIVRNRLSKDMKRRGFRFVGSTIIYAFMQGIGMVDDHVAGCWQRSGTDAMRPLEA